MSIVRTHGLSLSTLVLGALALPAPALAQQQEPAPAAPAASTHTPRQAAEVAVSSEALDLGYRCDLGRDGSLWIEALLDENDDELVHGRWLHTFPALHDPLPIEFGVGVGGYVVSLDHPDEDALAVALTGSAIVPLKTELPSRIALEVALAPDLTTFSDGEGLTDVAARFEVDLNEQVTVFAGYRDVEVDVDGGDDQTLDDRLGLGLRFTF